MSRNRLHVNKVDDFKKWLASIGWQDQKTKSYYEVLRMTQKGRKALIVHKKSSAEVHCTLHGTSELMFSKYMKSKR